MRRIAGSIPLVVVAAALTTSPAGATPPGDFHVVGRVEASDSVAGSAIDSGSICDVDHHSMEGEVEGRVSLNGGFPPTEFEDGIVLTGQETDCVSSEEQHGVVEELTLSRGAVGNFTFTSTEEGTYTRLGTAVSPISFAKSATTFVAEIVGTCNPGTIVASPCSARLEGIWRSVVFTDNQVDTGEFRGAIEIESIHESSGSGSADLVRRSW